MVVVVVVVVVGGVEGDPIGVDGLV